jgi:hypothetical protein
MDWDEYYEELARVEEHIKGLQRANPTKKWNNTSFADVILDNAILVRYTIDNQEGLLSLVDRCGIVKNINHDEDGTIRSFTVETYNQQLVEVPYEDGSFTGHYTHLQRLE